jgi:hypothetical protein
LISITNHIQTKSDLFEARAPAVRKLIISFEEFYKSIELILADIKNTMIYIKPSFDESTIEIKKKTTDSKTETTTVLSHLVFKITNEEIEELSKLNENISTAQREVKVIGKFFQKIETLLCYLILLFKNDEEIIFPLAGHIDECSRIIRKYCSIHIIYKISYGKNFMSKLKVAVKRVIDLLSTTKLALNSPKQFFNEFKEKYSDLLYLLFESYVNIKVKSKTQKLPDPIEKAINEALDSILSAWKNEDIKEIEEDEIEKGQLELFKDKLMQLKGEQIYETKISFEDYFENLENKGPGLAERIKDLHNDNKSKQEEDEDDTDNNETSVAYLVNPNSKLKEKKKKKKKQSLDDKSTKKKDEKTKLGDKINQLIKEDHNKEIIPIDSHKNTESISEKSENESIVYLVPPNNFKDEQTSPLAEQIKKLNQKNKSDEEYSVDSLPVLPKSSSPSSSSFRESDNSPIPIISHKLNDYSGTVSSDNGSSHFNNDIDIDSLENSQYFNQKKSRIESTSNKSINKNDNQKETSFIDENNSSSSILTSVIPINNQINNENEIKEEKPKKKKKKNKEKKTINHLINQNIDKKEEETNDIKMKNTQKRYDEAKQSDNNQNEKKLNLAERLKKMNETKETEEKEDKEPSPTSSISS